MLLLNLKNNGTFPCPRCLVKKADIDQLGTEDDMRDRVTTARKDNRQPAARIKPARREIFNKGRAVNSVYVQDKVDELSLKPIQVRCCLLCMYRN